MNTVMNLVMNPVMNSVTNPSMNYVLNHVMNPVMKPVMNTVMNTVKTHVTNTVKKDSCHESCYEAFHKLGITSIDLFWSCFPRNKHIRHYVEIFISNFCGRTFSLPCQLSNNIPPSTLTVMKASSSPWQSSGELRVR